jgi:hypothetical protein
MRRRLLLATLLLAPVAPGLAACELDGLFHGYGPTAALFAGAHRYQSLNGMADDADAEAEPPAEAKTVSASPTPPVGPRRSFVAWAKPKATAPGEAPATWTAPDRAAGTPPPRGD